jgi:FkbM family methyltransferase
MVSGGNNLMHVALLMVGAHNGQKQRETILQAAAHGMVILIEPVPHLFASLQQSYAGNPNIICLNSCVASQAGTVSFFAPTEEAIKAYPWGDQLGSMSSDHAVRHENALAAHIVEMQVNAVTFSGLVEQFGISTLDVLFTDTEGHDARLLPHFPFDRLRPNQIMFEFKHADGTFNIGRNLGRLLIMLDDLGYNMTIVDVENCLATRRR